MKLAFSLVLNVFLNRFSAGVSNGTSEISVAPKSSFFPKMFSKVFFMLFPNVKRSHLLEQSYNFKNTHLSLIMNKQMDVIFVYFHFDDSKMIPIGSIIHELFYIISKPNQQLFSVFTDKY